MSTLHSLRTAGGYLNGESTRTINTLSTLDVRPEQRLFVLGKVNERAFFY